MTNWDGVVNEALNSYEGEVSGAPNCTNFNIERRTEPIDVSEISGEWEGTYTCTQGLTGLTLTIAGSGKFVEAIFSFYEVPANQGVPSGSFRMEGIYNGNGKIDLEPTEWINQPPTYRALDFEADIDVSTGQIYGQLCGNDFSLTKTE